ncbi:MAG: homoserine dehydrogenase [Verrucomicrobiales bacterium]
MLRELKQRELEMRPIKVGLIGAGAMGIGIAWQVNRTPGMKLVFVGDIDISAAREAALSTGLDVREVKENPAISEVFGDEEVLVTGDPLGLMEQLGEHSLDVIVEASNTVGSAARYCLAAIERGFDIVLMNAEVDLALGWLLHHRAKDRGVVMTSDAGDQHGVLRRMIDEVQLWGFEIVQAGNIKGFLNRYATAQSLSEEAAKRNLSPIQCCAYTDGTKLSIEMACLANSVGLLPTVAGMEGPRAADVREALELFDFNAYGGTGRIDYLLGAEPEGGVYVVGRCDEPLQAGYMAYYKRGEGPYYLFYRPYHLCHIETPSAIAEAVILNRSVMKPDAGRITDVYAYAKRDLRHGELIRHAIGGDKFYGLVESCKEADAAGKVPLALLEAEGEAFPVMRDSLVKDQALKSAMVEIPDSFLRRKFDEQTELLRGEGVN